MSLPVDFDGFKQEVRDFAKRMKEISPNIKESLLNRHYAYLRDSKLRNSYTKTVEYQFLDQVDCISDSQKFHEIKNLIIGINS
jgi:hypothetical protein